MFTVTVPAATRYVWQGSPSPTPPYDSWANAATNIQDAVDAADPGDTVLVTNGVYATGGRTANDSTTNRVSVDKPLRLLSVNGPGLTIIDGLATFRCAYLKNEAVLSGFTLTNGRAVSGGGLWCESTNASATNCVLTGNSASLYGGGAYSGTLNDCTLSHNSAYNGGGSYEGTLNHCTLATNSAPSGSGSGGGSFYGTLNYCTLSGNSAGAFGGGSWATKLNHCTLTGNSAYWSGGGSAYGTLNHCTLSGNWTVRSSDGSGGGSYEGTLSHCTIVGNSASSGGGIAYGRLRNCIVYFNTASLSGNNWYDYTGMLDISYCCTTPYHVGTGNILLDPLFLDTNGWSNLRLQSNSPCINAGNNADVIGTSDLDGRPRIVGGMVDMGAYEFQGPGFSEFIGWLQHYGLPTDGSADTLDTDLDGHNAWQEWKAWTDPTNALSVLKLLPPQPDTNGTLVLWQSVMGQSYSVERATNASGPFSLLQGNIPGQAGITSVTDTNPANGNPILYRVAVP